MGMNDEDLRAAEAAIRAFDFNRPINIGEGEVWLVYRLASSSLTIGEGMRLNRLCREVTPKDSKIALELDARVGSDFYGYRIVARKRRVEHTERKGGTHEEAIDFRPKRLVSVSVSMAVPDVLKEIILRVVGDSITETNRFGIKHNEDEVVFLLRTYRKYHQDADFRHALDREFLKASTQRHTLSGIEDGAAGLYDFKRSLFGFDHPVMEECRSGIQVSGYRKKEQANV